MEKIEFKYLKILSIYSLIIGAASAVLSVPHAFMPVISLFILPFLGSIAPILLLIKKDNFDSENIKTYAVLGAISGFFISAGYYFLLLPIVWIIGLIFKNYYNYGVGSLNLFLFILFFTMIAVVYVVGNAVCGLICGGVHIYFKGQKNG